LHPISVEGDGVFRLIEKAQRDIDTLFDKPEYAVTLNTDWVQKTLTDLKWTDVISHLHDIYGATAPSVWNCLRQMTPEKQANFAEDIRNRLAARK
jgi:hypothetical protein